MSAHGARHGRKAPTPAAFAVAPVTEEQARAIAAWRYESPCDFEAQPPELDEVTDPDRRAAWRAVLDDSGELLGFFWFSPHAGEVEVGAGVRPDLVGSGLGLRFVDTAFAYAIQQWAPKRFRVSVATHNGRARRLYERAGFDIVGQTTRRSPRFGTVELVELERAA